MPRALVIDTITCKYSCRLCGDQRVSFEVPIRRLDQDVIDWMERRITPAMLIEHQKRSPGCYPETMSRIEIPAPVGSPMIGRPVEH